MLSLSKHLYWLVINGIATKRERCFDKLSMTFFNSRVNTETTLRPTTPSPRRLMRGIQLRRGTNSLVFLAF